MSDQAALLAAIKKHRREDTPRLMYADWLEENGRFDFAKCIRLWVQSVADPVAIFEAQVLISHLARSVGRLSRVSPFAHHGIPAGARAAREIARKNATVLCHDRGLFFSFVGTCYDWAHCSDSVIHSHPIGQVFLSNHPIYMTGFNRGHPGAENALFCLEGRSTWRKPKRHEYPEDRPEERLKIAKRLMKIEFPGIRFTYL